MKRKELIDKLLSMGDDDTEVLINSLDNDTVICISDVDQGMIWGRELVRKYSVSPGDYIPDKLIIYMGEWMNPSDKKA